MRIKRQGGPEIAVRKNSFLLRKQDRVLCSNCFVPSMAPPEPIWYIREPKHLVLCKNVRTSKKACRSSSVWDLAGVLTDSCLVKQGLYSCGTATESHRSFPVSFSGWPLRNQNSNRSSVSPNENRFQFLSLDWCSRRHHPSSNDENPSCAPLKKWAILRTGLFWKLCVVVGHNPIWLLTPTTCLADQLTWGLKKTQSQEDSWATQSQANKFNKANRIEHQSYDQIVYQAEHHIQTKRMNYCHCELYGSFRLNDELSLLSVIIKPKPDWRDRINARKRKWCGSWRP